MFVLEHGEYNNLATESHCTLPTLPTHSTSCVECVKTLLERRSSDRDSG